MVWSNGMGIQDILANLSQTQKPRSSQPRKVIEHPPVASPKQSFFNTLGVAKGMGGFEVDADPEYDWLMQADQMAGQVAKIRAKTQQQRTKNALIRQSNNTTIRVPNATLVRPGMAAPGGGLGPVKGKNFRAFIEAIAGKESGGSYGARNPDSGAMGKYQIMPANITGTNSGWDWEALGRDVSTQQFMNRPKLQEKIARHKLRQYFQKYGPRGAASAWYSGDPNKYKNTSPQNGYPSIAAYVQDILNRMGR